MHRSTNLVKASEIRDLIFFSSCSCQDRVLSGWQDTVNSMTHCLVRWSSFRLEFEETLAVFILERRYPSGRASVTMAVFILETRYPSGRSWANICQPVWLCVSSIKMGTRRVTRLDELYFVVRRSRRIFKDSSSRRITRLVPIFILETHNQTGYKCLPYFFQTGKASLA